MLITESFVPDSVTLLGEFLDALDVRQYDQDVYELEFTVEPFVEGAPGPHVQAAVDAVTAAGAAVDFGPFGSTCRATADDVPELVAALTRAALANGATHVHLHVAQVEDK